MHTAESQPQIEQLDTLALWIELVQNLMTNVIQADYCVGQNIFGGIFHAKTSIFSVPYKNNIQIYHKPFFLYWHAQSNCIFGSVWMYVPMSILLILILLLPKPCSCTGKCSSFYLIWEVKLSTHLLFELFYFTQENTINSNWRMYENPYKLLQSLFIFPEIFCILIFDICL